MKQMSRYRRSHLGYARMWCDVKLQGAAVSDSLGSDNPAAGSTPELGGF